MVKHGLSWGQEVQGTQTCSVNVIIIIEQTFPIDEKVFKPTPNN
jgi:hypothetical protein